MTTSVTPQASFGGANPSSRNNTKRPILVFDGDCGFCTMSVDFMKRWIRPRAQIVAWQFADLDELGLTQDQCTQAVQWVPASGPVSSGAAAVADALRASPVPWPVVGVVLAAPVMRTVADRVYKLIATNRYRLPGSTPACKVAAQATAA